MAVQGHGLDGGTPGPAGSGHCLGALPHDRATRCRHDADPRHGGSGETSSRTLASDLKMPKNEVPWMRRKEPVLILFAVLLGLVCASPPGWSQDKSGDPACAESSEVLHFVDREPIDVTADGRWIAISLVRPERAAAMARIPG